MCQDENDLAYFVGDVIFGDYIAVAHAFMFAMGVDIVFTEKNKPSDFIKRGMGIFVFGYVLNFLLKKIYVSKVAPFINMGENISKIYIIHWCIIGFVDSIFCYLLEIVFPYTFIYVFAVLLIFVCYWIAKRWALSKVPFIHH